MASTEHNRESVALTGALSNAIRLAILERLSSGTCLVGELAEAVGHGQAVVSKQLGILRAAGLLKCHHEGRCHEYSLADPEVTRNLLEAIEKSAALAARNALKCREQHMEEQDA